MELCACLDALFEGVPTEEALRRVRAAGMRCIEFWDWRVRDIESLAQQCAMLGLQVVAFSGNTFDEPLVDRSTHERGLAHLRRSLDIAARLEATLLVVHVGYASSGDNRSADWQAAVDGLRAAGQLARTAGVMLGVEPLNSKVDHPRYFLDSLDDALPLIDEVAHPSVRLVLDMYHMWLMHDDLPRRLSRTLPYAIHVHVADVPGRHEPGSGEIPWDEIRRSLRGYQGVVGLECWPTGTPEQAVHRASEVLG